MKAAYDFATENAEGAFFAGQGCQAINCSVLPAPGSGVTGQVNSSDQSVAVEALISNLADGETISWQALEPDGTALLMYSLTWNSNLGCFVGSDSQHWCTGGNNIDFAEAVTTNICQCFHTIGTWTISLFDNGTLVSGSKSAFSVAHNPQSPLAITSPTPPNNWNAVTLVDLAADQNYTATDAVCPSPVNAQGNETAACFAANTNTGNTISWSATLQYSTSAYATTGKGTSITDGPRTFNTASGQQQEETYQNEGGQVSATASTTASDGSTIQDCETFYIEGPAGGIPGPATSTNPQDVITPLLDSLYPQSSSYQKYLVNDGTPTNNLMTGIAYHETQYRQFTSPADNPPNSDLFNLKADLGVNLPNGRMRMFKPRRRRAANISA